MYKPDPNMLSGNVRSSGSCSSMWLLLKHNTWGLMVSISKEFIDSSASFLSPLTFW